MKPALLLSQAHNHWPELRVGLYGLARTGRREGALIMTYVFEATLQKEDDGRWSAQVDALPGCAAWGYTREKALETLHEGVEIFVESMLDRGLQVLVEEIKGADGTTVTVTVDGNGYCRRKQLLHNATAGFSPPSAKYHRSGIASGLGSEWIFTPEEAEGQGDCISPEANGDNPLP